VERQRHGESDERAGAQCGDQNSLGHPIEHQEQKKDNEAGKRTLQQVALKMGFSKLAVEVQKTAPSGDGAEFT